MSQVLSAELPYIHTAIPGPQSQAWIDRLSTKECPAITSRRARRAQALGAAKDDPIVWKSAQGCIVEDMDGNRFIDMTAGFGVAAVGHRNPKVVAALQAQSEILLHAMGDAFSDPKRIELMEKLCAITGMDRCIFGSSGSDSVEVAIKTAKIATNRSKILAFHNAYHGLAFGSLSSTHYKAEMFRGPFTEYLGNYVDHIPYNSILPEDLSEYAAIVVEPIQGRGGVQVGDFAWLKNLIEQAHQQGALVIFDEIYTGFGRTGSWFAFQHPQMGGLKPDLLCIGKALAGGFPISACLGTAKVMDAWGASKGEAIHTQTFLGNPLGCAMALAALEELEELFPSIAEKSQWFIQQLQSNGFQVQGRGLLLGIPLSNTLAASRLLLHKGFIILPAGPNAEVIALTPPLMISKAQLQNFIQALKEVVREI